ncbi:hypothetical protein U729_3250 (plasmid) [Clostridium baratii str. Sullivan]|uniref:Uncharacterized protein n=1 Tax=Clostridium baratii str. Sullivan TaxID=1415775 RepID=A0A0A7G072_9CLOT|nr:hypothetical protein [Clostridium baratii]AIY85237.1 hypothetical protein U729_3250 [Clostridium baratii str. Sullivan]
MQDKKYIGASITRKKNSRIFHYLEENPMISPSKLVKIAVTKYLDSIGYEVNRIEEEDNIKNGMYLSETSTIPIKDIDTNEVEENGIKEKDIIDDIDNNIEVKDNNNTDIKEEVVIETNGDIDMDN